MNKILDSYLAILAAVALVIANTALSFAEDGSVIGDEVAIGDEVVTGSAVQQEVDSPLALSKEQVEQDKQDELELKEQEEFLTRLKKEFNLSKSEYHQLLNNVSDAKEHLDYIHEEKITLERQLNNIEGQIEVTTLKLIDAVKKVVKAENQIALLYEEIEKREVALKYQKELLKDYVRVLYEEQNSMIAVDEDGEINAFKLLLSDKSVGDNLKELKYFDLLNEAGLQLVDKLDVIAKDLKQRQTDLKNEKNKLKEAKDELAKEQNELKAQKDAKERLLKLTLGKEKIYSELLEQTIKEQEQMLDEVRQLNDSIAFVEQKIKEDGSAFDPDKYLDLLDPRTRAIYEFNYTYEGSLDGFAWPVMPDKSGISAYFRDPGYVGVFGVQHNAIDIPEYQGSPVYAAADGVVFKAKDNGYGYSYIILAHAGGFQTVYGHVSGILVKEGDIISRGAIIGLSGGMPGTKGAGYMTTGPHLHFEMMLNGTHVDPLKYLSLSVLDKDHVENLPERYKDAWKEDVGAEVF